MKRLKKIVLIVMLCVMALGMSFLSTSCSKPNNGMHRHSSFISNEIGGGGVSPSIVEPDKTYPQPEPTFDDQDYVVKNAYTRLSNGDGLSYEEVAPENRRSSDELPLSYTQIEYLESTDVQWIETGYSPTLDTRVVLSFERSSKQNLGFIFGTGQHSGNATSLFGLSGATTGYLLYAFAGSTTNYNGRNLGYVAPDIKHDIDFTCATVKIDSTVINTNLSFVPTSATIKIFKSYYVSKGFKLYSFKIFEGASETPEMDFVPCINEKGFCGLYDTIGQKFYGNNGDSFFNASCNISGTGTESDPYQVGTVENFISMIAMSDSNKSYILTNDIAFNDGYFEENDDGTCTYHDGGDGVLWDWINISTKFKQFDGQNHTIKNFYSTKYGLFRLTWGGSATNIENFKMVGGYVETNILTGMVTINSNYYRRFENIEVDGVVYSTANNTDYYADGKSGCALICGGTDSSFNYVGNEFVNCITRGKVTMAGPDYNHAGGVSCVGGTFKNCINYASISANRAGGILGSAQAVCSFENCKNFGTMNAKKYAGGIAGHVRGSGTYINCENYGKINASEFAAGILGRQGNGSRHSFYNCTNNGDVLGATYCCGMTMDNVDVVQNCYNYGNMRLKGGNASYAMSSDVKFASNCFNYGTAWGLFGSVAQNGEVRDCKNFGKTYDGLIRTLGTGAVMINCINEYKGQSNCGLVSTCSGKIYRCVNESNATYGLVNTLNGNGEIYECESFGDSTYYIANKINAGGVVQNCYCTGASQRAVGTNNGTLVSVIYNGTTNKEYYGTNFDGFFVKWKTGYIGLKSMESAGVYMFAIPDEEYMQRIGYTKMG